MPTLLGGAAPRPNVVPDDLRQKYSPTRRVEFHVACSNDTSIFLLASGVQILTPTAADVSESIEVRSGV